MGESLRSLNKKRVHYMKKDFVVRSSELNSHYGHTLWIGYDIGASRQ